MKQQLDAEKEEKPITPSQAKNSLPVVVMRHATKEFVY